MTSFDVSLDQLIAPAATERAGSREFPILSMTMHEGLVDQATKFKKRIASSDTSDYKIVRRNQLVVGFPIDEGVLSIQDLYDDAIVSPAYAVWSVRGDYEVDPAYLERFLRSPRAIAFYRAKLRGTTARRRTIPDDVFLRLRVPLPTLPEQRRIAEVLDRADALRVKRRATRAELDRFIPALFLEMFGDPATNPRGYRKQPLGDLIKLKSGDFLPAVEMAKSGIYPVVGGNGISGFHDQYKFDDPQVVIGRVGANCGCICVSPPKSWITDNALYVSERDPALTFDYLVHALTHLRLNQYASQFGQPLVSGSRIYPVPVLVPPKDAQQEFAARAARSAELKSAYEKSMTCLDVLFTSLQYRAFRGDL